MAKPITAQQFDRMASAPRPPSLAADSLWSAVAIAKFIGVSDDFVRKLERDGGAPLRRVGGRLYSTRTEITAWLDGQRDGFSGSNRIQRI